jgi:hypothetical protein
MYCVAHSKKNEKKPASQLRYYIAYHPADYCAIILSVIILRNAGRLLWLQLLLRWPTVQISRYVGTTTGSHYAIIRQIEY